MKKPKKLMIIGLDGVPLEIIQPWADAGYLPNMKGLMDTGAVGRLFSAIPPTSGPSWSSFMTGMNPGKTGIYDFLYRREGTYNFPPVNASQRSGTTIWRYLSDAGHKVGVLNLPMSYPVEKINGFMVSGWMTPYAATDYIHPPELAAELEHAIGEYRIYPTETFRENRRDAFLNASYELLEMRTRTALYLAMERRASDTPSKASDPIAPMQKLLDTRSGGLLQVLVQVTRTQPQNKYLEALDEPPRIIWVYRRMIT